MKKSIAGMGLMLGLGLGLVGCGVVEQAIPKETVTAYATVEASPSESVESSATVTETATATATATATVEADSGEPDGTILDSARYYMEVGDMSKQSLINALVSEGWSYASAEEAEATVRPEYNYDEEAKDAVRGYLEYTPEATREELITYLHVGLLFTEKGSVRIVEGFGY